MFLKKGNYLKQYKKINFHKNLFKFERLSEEEKRKIFLTCVDKLNEGDIPNATLRLKNR